MISKRKLMIVGIALSIVVIVVVGVMFISKVIDSNKNDNNAGNNTKPIPIVNYKTLDNGTMLNISPKIALGKQFTGLDITDIQITCVKPISTDEATNNLIKGKTDIIATVTNNTEETLGGYFVDITFVNEKGIPISDSKIYAQVIKLNPGETAQLNGAITENLVNAYDIKIEMATEE